MSEQTKDPFRSRDYDVAATSLRNQFCCFGVVLLHPVFATVTKLPVAGESLCNPFGSDVADASLSLVVRVHLHLATAISLWNQIYCFGVVQLHTAFATVTNSLVAMRSLCERINSDIAGHCTGFQLLVFGVVLFLNKVNIKMRSALWVFDRENAKLMIQRRKRWFKWALNIHI